jgi:hypothetical protein
MTSDKLLDWLKRQRSDRIRREAFRAWIEMKIREARSQEGSSNVR